MDEVLKQEVNMDRYLAVLREYESAESTFHPSGVLDPEQFSDLTSRPSCEFTAGVPTSVALHEQGVLEAARAVKMAEEVKGCPVDDEDIRLSFLPAPFVIKNISSYRAKGENARTRYVFCEYDLGAPGSDDMDEAEGEGFRVHRLVNPLTNTEAGLNLYQAVVEVPEVDPSADVMSLTDTVRHMRVPLVEQQSDGGTLTVKIGGDFSEEEQESMWQLFSKRFQDISDNLPIRLEEGRDETIELFNNPSYVFIYRTEPDGTVSCAAMVTDERESYPWISPAFIDPQDEKVRQREDVSAEPYSVFVPGVAAYKKEGARASDAVLHRLVDVVSSTGRSLDIYRFECTDVSSLYIPKICEEVWRTNSKTGFLGIEQLGQKKYVMIEVAPEH